LWTNLIRVVGVVSIWLSLWGGYLLVSSLRQEVAQPLNISDAPYFRQVFLLMNAVDMVFLVLIVIASSGLLRLQKRAAQQYTWVYLALVVYAFAPGLFWGTGPLGRSIAAASGVADMGVAPLLFKPVPFGYAITSVIVVHVAFRRLRLNSKRTVDSS